MTSRIPTVLLLASLSLAVTAGPADAQLGGLIKKKVTEALKGPDKIADEPKASLMDSPFGDVVLEITPPVFEGFFRGLTVEVNLMKEFRAELAKYPTVEQRTQCERLWKQSEEFQKLFVQPIADDLTTEQALAIIQKRAAEADAAMRKKCPIDQDQVWPDAKRRERMEQIKARAAEGAGAAAAPSTGAAFGLAPDLMEDGAGTPQWRWDEAWAAGLTVQQYAMLFERVTRFCEELKTAASSNMGGAGGVRFPGSRQDIFWVYSAAEAKTLSQANCQRVWDLVGQLTP